MAVKNRERTANQNQTESNAGYKFYPNNYHWQLDKNTKIPIGSMFGFLETESERSCLKVLQIYAETYSSSHVQNIFFRFLHYLRTVKTNTINSNSLINYRSALRHGNEWYLGTIRGFLKKWNELGYPGVSIEVIDLLDGWTIKGNVKGDVIKRLDPTRGPLSDFELQGFNEVAVQAFERDNASLSEMAIALVTSNTGRRPIQVSHLRIKDILKGKNKKSEDVYLLNVPRAKQRATYFREQFRQFSITKELWTIVSAQAESVVQKIEEVVGFAVHESDRVELPLFPDMSLFHEGLTATELKALLEADALHIRSSKVTDVCKKIAATAGLYSERTGELLNISSNRFRYTTGTRAAREGFGEMVIAELLDHSDNQNAGVYIQNIPEHVESLDKAVGHQMARYAQAFAGVLVDHESDAIRGEDLNSRIQADGKGVGTCGSHGFCGANVPIPCYTCIHFQPWLEGPHQEVYRQLISERERLLSVTGDKQIAAVNDRSILAVTDVIQRCSARLKEMAND